MARRPQTITVTISPRQGLYHAHLTGWSLQDSPGSYGSTWALDCPLTVAETASAREVLQALAAAIAARAD